MTPPHPTSHPTSPPPPSRPEEITSAWLAATLSTSTSTRPVDARRLGIAAIDTIGQGFLGTVARVALTGCPIRSVICKFAHDDPDVREQVFALGSYQRESWFYRELAPHMPLRVPTCWLADTDPVLDRHVLVLEDLSEKSLISQLAGCPPAAARAVVDDLASLHRAGLTAEQGNMLPRADGDEAWFALVDSSIDEALDRPDLSPALRTLTAGFSDYGRALAVTLGERSTVTHADARIENVFFDGDGARTWIDWDGVQLANGAAELAYFSSQSLTVEVRRAHETALVERYHAALTEAGTMLDYSLEACWTDYRLGLLSGWAVGIAAIAAYGELTGDSAELVSAGVERVATAIADNDAMDVLDDLL